MPTYEPWLVAALLFLTRAGAEGARGSPPVGRKLLQHLATSWNLNQKVEGEEIPSHLEWVDFNGTLPADTVSNWNNYTKTTEYVCSTEVQGCNVGAHVPSRGPFCFYPFWESEQKTSSFKVLVNRGDLEALRWVDDSFGDVPETAVEGCPSADIYVGRNRYGLGKVSKEQQAFFVVVDHEEVWFKWYQVLAVRAGPADVTISDVHYNTSEAMGGGEEVTLTKTTVKNEGCRGRREDVTLEEAAEVVHDWELDQEVFSTIHGALRAAPLAFNGTSWEATNVTRVTWMGRATTGEYVVHTRRVEVEMRPRTTCTVALVGRQLDVRVPFAAWLSRDFGDGQPHRVAVTGVARSRVVVDVRAGVEQCSPLAGSLPCR
ncbi:natterin-3-like [Oxyura jamaicensis]|uniref:natterin-3-like n=1 Tax=Oxyura jamaicensis TaxID=8884 RepID=UPI0015A52EFA|nr:natterin-3-like [Oxyura jamaicensis]